MTTRPRCPRLLPLLLNTPSSTSPPLHLLKHRIETPPRAKTRYRKESMHQPVLLADLFIVVSRVLNHVRPAAPCGIGALVRNSGF
ncbi:unnamed protein product [Phaeothamnion confervicola]